MSKEKYFTKEIRACMDGSLTNLVDCKTTVFYGVLNDLVTGYKTHAKERIEALECPNSVILFLNTISDNILNTYKNPVAKRLVEDGWVRISVRLGGDLSSPRFSYAPNQYLAELILSEYGL
jgi:hypothetical protein